MKIKLKVYRFLAKTILVLAVLIFVGVVGFVGLQISGKNKLYKQADSTGPDLSQVVLPGNDQTDEDVRDVLVEEPDNWQEGDVRYNGVHYRYNQDILTFLFLGIDKMGEVKPVKNGIDGGQSDALFLLVLNPHNKEASVIGIPRDTMTEIEIYSKENNYIGPAKAQIALQHGYGDGAQVSCERSMTAVSKLFYDLPIHGYCSINMGGIPTINDAVGGVEVIALEDVIWTDIKKGQSIHLKGRMAYEYLHNRDVKVPESAAGRLSRQKQYLLAYADTAKVALKEDVTLLVTLYNALSKYMVTDIDLDEVTYLGTQALSYQFGEDNFHVIEGEINTEGKFEEFYADETALYELILKVFYEEVEPNN